MGTKDIVSSSKSEKSCSPLQEHQSFYRYPDWASIQGYYGPGVPTPSHYFNATIAPGHVPHPYMWAPQPGIPPFAGPYTVYPHGGVYTHPSTYMAFPVKQEIPAKLSTSKDTEANSSKVLDPHVMSVGNNFTGSEECVGNEQSPSGTKEEEGSSDGIDRTTDSGGSKFERSRSSDDIPNSERDTTPTISLEMGAPCVKISRKRMNPDPPANHSPVVDLKATSSGKVKHDGMPLFVPTSSAKEEKELKREKRKQSNRESARRSRLRKQAEAEELAVKVGTLNAENTELRSEVTRLTEISEKLRLENSMLMDKLKLRQLNQAQDMAPAMVIENLLSRIEYSNLTVGSSQFEDEAPPKSNGTTYQLLDSNRSADSALTNS